MKTSQIKKITIICILALITVLSMTPQGYTATDHALPQASVIEASQLSYRSEKKLGTYVSLFGDPQPTLVGLNVAYNLLDFMRASLGLGRVTIGASASVNGEVVASSEISLTTLGAGVKLLIPGWSISPVAGLGYSHSFFSGDVGEDLPTLDNIYSNLGFDWQSKSGFNAGVGMNLSFNSNIPAWPYVNLGWFF